MQTLPRKSCQFEFLVPKDALCPETYAKTFFRLLKKMSFNRIFKFPGLEDFSVTFSVLLRFWRHFFSDTFLMILRKLGKKCGQIFFLGNFFLSESSEIYFFKSSKSEENFQQKNCIRKVPPPVHRGLCHHIPHQGFNPRVADAFVFNSPSQLVIGWVSLVSASESGSQKSQVPET